MPRHLSYIAISSAAPVVAATLLMACGCATNGNGDGASHDAVERYFAGPVQVRPLRFHGVDQEGTDNMLVQITSESGETLGYAAELEVVSRSGPFPIRVVLDAKQCVREVRVLRYTARRGRGVLSKSFASQFQGKCAGEPIQIGADIDAVTGATLSSQAVADGVRRVVDLVARSAPN